MTKTQAQNWVNELTGLLQGKTLISSSFLNGKIEVNQDVQCQKKKGMSWSLVGSRSLALLKLAELNGRWLPLWFSQPTPA